MSYLDKEGLPTNLPQILIGQPEGEFDVTVSISGAALNGTCMDKISDCPPGQTVDDQQADLCL